MSARVLAATAALVLVPVTLAPAAAAAPLPTCAGVEATIVGTPADDHMTATPGDDVIVSLGGDDTVLGRGGDDLICGGDGQDELRGGPGDDELHGERDGFHNFRGSRYVLPDFLDGGAGDDLLDVGADDRTISFGTFGLLDYSRAASGVTVDLVAGTVTGQGTDTVVPVDGPDCGLGCYGIAVFGSPQDDVLLGSESGDYLIGMAGDDTIDGRGGADELRGEDESGRGPADDDTLTGGEGDDMLVTNVGRDVLSGDDGDDAVWSTGGGPSQAYGGVGDDRVVVQLARRPGFVLDGGDGYDLAQLGGPRSRPAGGGRPTAALVTMEDGQVVANEVTWGTIAGTDDLSLGSNVHWEYHGTDEAEILRSDGLDLLAFLYGGDDSVFGTNGDDTIDAGDGNDKVRGHLGTDTCTAAEVTWSCEVE
jgi:Ca2+-binding RTX toxin-like protein